MTQLRFRLEEDRFAVRCFALVETSAADTGLISTFQPATLCVSSTHPLHNEIPSTIANLIKNHIPHQTFRNVYTLQSSRPPLRPPDSPLRNTPGDPIPHSRTLQLAKHHLLEHVRNTAPDITRREPARRNKHHPRFRPPLISNPDTSDSFTSYWDSPICGKITMHFSRSTEGTPVWNPPDVVGGHYTEMNQPLPWPPSIGIDTALEASRRQGLRRGFYVVTYCWDFLVRQPSGVPIYWFGARDGGWAIRVDNQDVRPYVVGDGLNESALQDPS